MKAFILSIVALVAITAVTAGVLSMAKDSSTERYTTPTSGAVRL